MTHPDHALWKQGWRANQIPFHLAHVHPLLVRFWPSLGLTGDERVFVPLCGKSLDMMWLHGLGHRVVGVELSSVAIRHFFSAAALRPRCRDQGELTRWAHERLEIFCGDVFALTPADLRGVRAVFDRAALTALPENRRAAYVAHLHAILPADCDVLLLTVDDLEDDEDAAACMESSAEILALYRGFFTLDLLHAEYHQSATASSDNVPEPRCVHKVYRLRRAAPAT
jgi:thiopurine S-methyltransferase